MEMREDVEADEVDEEEDDDEVEDDEEEDKEEDEEEAEEELEDEEELLFARLVGGFAASTSRTPLVVKRNVFPSPSS